jgi:peptide/nickel transport system substrate-binding protein
MVKEGRFDLLLAGWYMNDIPDLRFAVRSDGSQNLSGYNDVEMDELLDEVMQSYTRETISASFERVQQKIIEDLPIISLYFRTHTLLTRRNITNVIQVKEESAYSSIQYWNIK